MTESKRSQNGGNLGPGTGGMRVKCLQTSKNVGLSAGATAHIPGKLKVLHSLWLCINERLRPAEILLYLEKKQFAWGRHGQGNLGAQGTQRDTLENSWIPRKCTLRTYALEVAF